MGKKFLKIFAAWALAYCLFGCTLISGSSTERVDVGAQVQAYWWDGPRVRPGVALIIQIGVTSAQPLIFSVMVDQNGEIVVPHLLQKAVKCDGLTLEELKEKLVQEYAFFYRQPQISVTFAPYDGKGVSPWGTITVLGEVLMPGPVNIPSTMNVSVTKALQMAGGLKQFADRTRIQVTRCDKEGNQEKTTIDLVEIGKGRPDKDMLLRAGDVVWVPETWY